MSGAKKDVILRIDFQGAMKDQGDRSQALMIFLLPTSETESMEQIGRWIVNNPGTIELCMATTVKKWKAFPF